MQNETEQKALSAMINEDIRNDTGEIKRAMQEKTNVELSDYLKKGHDMVSALCKGKYEKGGREWMMSIPAQQDYDPDLVLGDALRAGDEALKRIKTYENVLNFIIGPKASKAMMILHELFVYWGTRRGAGHTRIIQKGIENDAEVVYVVESRRNLPRNPNNRVMYVTLNEIPERLRGCTWPLVIDHFALTTLLKDAGIV